MQRRLTIFFTILLALTLIQDSFAEGTPRSAEQLAADLLEETGGTEMAQQVMQMMSVQMRQAFPSVPDDFWNELIESLDAAELSEMLIPIYTKHYSRDDLQGLLTFYRSPLGQRVRMASPAIARESMAVGSTWGQRKAEEIVERLEQKGYQPEQI